MNNKKKLVIITGITMAGKSSTAKELVRQLQAAGVAVELLKETTTRPKRESDYENPEYHFVTEKEFNQKEFLTSANFKVTSGETWRYGIEMQEFPEMGVIVSNMYAIDTLLCDGIPEDLDVKIFYLNISEEEVLKRDKTSLDISWIKTGDEVPDCSLDELLEEIKTKTDSIVTSVAKLQELIAEVNE